MAKASKMKKTSKRKSVAKKAAAVSAAPAPAAPDPILELLQHVAESEHHLRHPQAFKAVVEKLGFALEHVGHRWEVKTK